jgi:pyroglutamyl-peptidase
MKILVTAFEPFDQKSSNQSSMIARSLLLDHVEILILPVAFKLAFQTLENHLKTCHYDMIIMLGEGPNKVLHLEHVALNIMHARIPDNLGYQPLNTPIDDGPLSLKSTLPLKQFSEILNKHNYLYNDSYHAGTYVCNDLFYRVMRLNLTIPCGFIHVPNDVTYHSVSRKSLMALLAQL